MSGKHYVFDENKSKQEAMSKEEIEPFLNELTELNTRLNNLSDWVLRFVFPELKSFISLNNEYLIERYETEDLYYKQDINYRPNPMILFNDGDNTVNVKLRYNYSPHPSEVLVLFNGEPKLLDTSSSYTYATLGTVNSKKFAHIILVREYE